MLYPMETDVGVAGLSIQMWMLSHAEVQHAPAIMRQDQKDKQQTEGRCRDNEEVSGNQLMAVIREKGLPGL
jgi:hypothetical protein